MVKGNKVKRLAYILFSGLESGVLTKVDFYLSTTEQYIQD